MSILPRPEDMKTERHQGEEERTARILALHEEETRLVKNLNGIRAMEEAEKAAAVERIALIREGIAFTEREAKRELEYVEQLERRKREAMKPLYDMEKAAMAALLTAEDSKREAEALKQDAHERLAEADAHTAEMESLLARMIVRDVDSQARDEDSKALENETRIKCESQLAHASKILEDANSEMEKARKYAAEVEAGYKANDRFRAELEAEAVRVNADRASLRSAYSALEDAIRRNKNDRSP